MKKPNITKSDALLALSACATLESNILDYRDHINNGSNMTWGEFVPVTGLCDNISQIVNNQAEGTECNPDTIMYMVSYYTSQWPMFTGSHVFPIPYPRSEAHKAENINLKPEDLRAHAYCNLPKYTGPYGDLRLNLLRHIIASLQFEIAQMEQEDSEK